MTTPMSLDSGSSSNSQEMELELIAQVGEAIGIIDSVHRLIDNTLIWNKRQCERILQRFTDIRDRFKSMEWDRKVDDLRRASDGGPIYDELVQVLEKGKILVLGYVAGRAGIANVLSRTDNREAFQEINEELDTVEAKLGFQNLEEDIELTTTAGFQEKLRREKLSMKEEAEEDKKEMPEIFSHMQSTGEAMEHSEKLAKVVSDKTIVDEDVTKLVDKRLLPSSDESELAGASNAVTILPSYLHIDLDSEIVKKEPVRKYERLSEHDPEEEVGWAAVYFGTWLGFDFALKVFKCGAKDGQAAAWNRTQLLKEAGSLAKLQHPHVVRLVGFGQDDDQSIFVMELMDGDLRQLMKSRSKPLPEGTKPFTSSEELDIINQVAKGMYFMHTKGYVHGDLKCSNIVYKRFAKQNLEVKLSDLRGAQKLDPKSDKVVDPKACEEASKTRRPRWTAPEAIDHYGGSVEPTGNLLKANDVYSFGMTCYEIVTGKLPFDGIRGALLLKRIKEGAAEEWNPFPLEMDKGLKGLITLCWDKKPSNRPSFSLICHHLNTIRSKGLPAEKNQSCGGMVARVLSQIKQIPIISRFRHPEVRSPVLGAGNELSKLSTCFESASEPPQNNTFILAPEYEYLSIRPKQLKRLETIGHGSSSQVYKATWLNSTFAVKILKQRYSADLEVEVDLLLKVSRHPCIVQLVGLSQISDDQCAIVMEYMDTNLRKLIETRMEKKPKTAKPFTFREEVLIISTIAWGMVYLHSRGLVHRDLNSLNVLAQDYSPIVVVKIVDFGRSYLQTRVKKLEGSSNSSEKTPVFYSGRGTSCFRAPEMLNFSPESNEELPEGLPHHSATADLSALKATDVYSFAMLCYEVLTGRCPCSEKEKVILKTDYAAWRKYRPTYWPKDSDAELQSLVEECWSMNPKKRPTFREICNRLPSQFQKQPASD